VGALSANDVGVAATSMLMIYAGYLGDFVVTSREFGGFEMTIEPSSRANPQSVYCPCCSHASCYGSVCSCRRCRICTQ
jgi:hypothetical protein